MPKPIQSSTSDLTAELSSLLSEIPGAREGRSFGNTAFFASDKVFAFAYQDGVVLKLPASRVQDLLELPGFAPFQMRNKPVMREWIVLRRDTPEGYALDLDLFREAAAFVIAPPEVQKKHS
jgi:hypothetical protein